MTRGFEAINRVTIDAPKTEVWDALTNPAKVQVTRLDSVIP